MTTFRRLESLAEDLQDAEHHCSDKMCVYVTGSFARGEASAHSDLDLFILTTDDKPGHLDETLLKAALITCTRNKNIPDFSNDGEYLVCYTKDNLIKTLGKPEDDARNTFTARLLLLLESKHLLGKSIYDQMIKDVIDAYWLEFDDHKHDFVPAFLTNDILRLWRTF